jgi:hypothetical protein
MQQVSEGESIQARRKRHGERAYTNFFFLLFCGVMISSDKPNAMFVGYVALGIVGLSWAWDVFERLQPYLPALPNVWPFFKLIGGLAAIAGTIAFGVFCGVPGWVTAAILVGSAMYERLIKALERR